MTGLETAPLPLDFVAVHAAGSAIRVAHFAAGRPVVRPRKARLVLHAALDGEPLRAWEATGALCVPAERLLALLEPEVPRAAFVDAVDVGERYLRAASRLPPQGEVLRRAAETLPADDATLRSLLHRTLAELAVAALGGQPEPTQAARVASSAEPPCAPAFEWPPLAPHDLLDRAFQHLHAWRRADHELPFAVRAGQAEMAHAVLDALHSGESLVVEAGTGVGKTIAYVLPALLLAATRGGRFLVSTHTRNLQHQLVARDLPELWRCFGLEAAPRPGGDGRGLRFAKLLGRGNYVCRTALGRAARQAVDSGGSFELAQALVWSLCSASGELEEIAVALDARLLGAIASRREACQGRACRGDFPCPVYVARDAARRADVVVVNHALLFSDAASDGSILGCFDGIVLDESQHLEAVATEHLSIHIGRPQADALVAPLGRLGLEGRALGGEPGLGLRLERYGQQVATLRQQLLDWLDALDADLPAVAGRRPRQAYRDGGEVFAGVERPLARLLEELESVAGGGLELAAECGARGDDPSAAEAASCLELLAALQRETRAGLEFVTAAGNEDWAFYLDLGTDGARLCDVAAAPLDVAADVHRLLGATAGSAIYTSATLGVGEDFEYFMKRIGLSARTRQVVIPSPFDYAEQCLVVQAQHLPDWNEPGFAALVAELLAGIAERTGRRMLVLLTAHAALRRLHAELLRRLGPRAPLLAQDVSGSRGQLAARFAATPGALLLGTSSFWEGVDFPGRALEVLAIVKLPFLVPEEPLVAARCERMRRHGEDPFGDYVLPEAVLRFKQGFGRLVRSHHDRGVVLLLDSRLGERRYGEVFLQSLPVRPESFLETEALVARVVGWLEEHAPG